MQIIVIRKSGLI